jgi:hypothetical protein
MRRSLGTVIAVALLAASCGGNAVNSTLTTTTALPGRPATTVPGQQATTTTTALSQSTTTTVLVDPEAIAKQIEELKAVTADLRGLEFLQPVEVRLLTDDEYQARVLALVDEELTAEDIAADAAWLRLLGVIGPETDLKALYTRLFSGATGGFYDPETNELVVRLSRGTLGPYAQSIVVHELTHALQDQHYDLLDQRRELEGDELFVATAISEGDATIQAALFVNELGVRDRARYLSELQDAVDSLTALADIPEYLFNSLQQPYDDGTYFQLDHGPDRIDETFANLPDSSEQIRNVTKYLIDEQPSTPTPIPDLSYPGYELTHDTVMGEADIELLLAPEVGASVAAEAAAGWGGDRVRIYSRDGTDAVFVVSYRADGAADAEEFAEAWSRFFERVLLPGTYGEVERSGDRVMVVAASDGSLGPELDAQLNP